VDQPLGDVDYRSGINDVFSLLFSQRKLDLRSEVPDFLIEELHKRNTDDSQTKESLERELRLCQARLKAMPDEQRRLVEGYRKGLHADFMMREEMERMQKEQVEFEKRRVELKRQLAQRQLTESQEEQIRNFTARIGKGLDSLKFAGR
jgi:hypothetical protein